MVFNWNTFSAFNGTLDKSFLDSTKGLQASIDKFYAWLQALRNHPELHGIPTERVLDVGRLFQALSGSEHAESSDQIPVLRPVLDRVDSGGKRILEPVTVSLGPQATEISITDAASGIGYLFSIVNPPSSVDITWSGYFMPLLILFSKCLYLAFVAEVQGKYVLSGVPIMANVMYLAGRITNGKFPQPFIFGATISAGPQSIAKDGLFENRRGLTTTWRRDELLVPTLSRVQKSLPLLDEFLAGPLVKQLHVLILGHPHTKDPSDPECPLVSGLETVAWSTMKRILARNNLKKSSVVQVNRLLKDVRTQATTTGLLRKLVDLRYAGNYNPKDQAVLSACQGLLRFYVTPHVFVEDHTRPQTLKEVALTPNEDAEITDLVNALWELCGETLLSKVYQLKERQELYEIPPAEVVYGRCAETYSVVCIQPTYFPATQGHMADIRGLAMEPRAIGTTKLFDTMDFSSATLKEIPIYVRPELATRSIASNFTTKKACRYPCKYCRHLLSELGIPAVRPFQEHCSYDMDIDAADVGPW